jgi:hypothetical protein
MSHLVVALLPTVASTAAAKPTGPQAPSTSPDLLTDITNVLTAIAIVVGGAFAYFKFIRGRVLNAAILLEVNAALTSRSAAAATMPKPSAFMVEITLRNNAQRALTVPKDSTLLVSVSSVTEEELAQAGEDLTQYALNWKRPDAYFAQTNLLLDNGEPPITDIVLGPGGAMTLAAVFAVPCGHKAAAYLVVANSKTVYRSWWRQDPDPIWIEGRKLVAPG